MSIYAISDLHLSHARPKPMDVFGEIWTEHDKRIAENWDAAVSPDDTVLIAGDHSWAMKADEAMPDLEYIAARPGHKILIRGNHDYWWRRESTNRIQALLPEGVTLLQGKSVMVGSVGITGTRGWRVELEEDTSAGNSRVMQRELSYLERGLTSIPAEAKTKIVVLHYPPFNADLELNEFADLLQAYGVDILVYGHIHTGYYLEGDVNGVDYRLVSVDHTDFKPVLILD